MLRTLAFFVLAVSARLKGRFLQISDLHFDQYYVEGSFASCVYEAYNDGMCCRDESVGTKPFYKARRYGDFHCDAPIALLQLFFQYLNATFTNHPELMPDFIIWTGDNDNHHKRNISKATNLYAIQTMTDLFSTWLPSLQVFPALGNLDTYPDGELSMPPDNLWLTSKLAEIWGRWLHSAEAKQTIEKGGYYAHPAPSQEGSALRVISLNTLLSYTGYDYGADPAGMWRWLADQVTDCAARGEKIWMIGHIPVHMYPQPRLYQYLNLLQKYPDTVVGHFSGHTHRDFFVLLRGNNTPSSMGPLLGTSFASPSVVPDNVLPSFRLFDYDLNSKRLLDVHTYGLLNFEALNAGTAALPVFGKRYSFLQAYGMGNLEHPEWERLVVRMKTDMNLFNTFYTNFHAGTASAPCSESCHWGWVCNLTFTNAVDRRYCIDHPSPTPTEPPTTPPPSPPTKPPTTSPPSPPTKPPTLPPSPPTRPPSKPPASSPTRHHGQPAGEE